MTRHRFTFSIVVLAFLTQTFLFGSLLTARADLSPVALRCEYRVNPLGVDAVEPRLSWKLESTQRAKLQTAWQVLVASSPEKLAGDQGDLWDSGRVESSSTGPVAYQGKTLVSRMQCYWKVRVWDEADQPSAWSGPAQWSMGLIKPEDWSARFISMRDDSPIPTNPKTHHLPPAKYFRKKFNVEKPIRRATLYATSLGINEMYVGGQRVGDVMFAPGWTDYRKRVYYNTYDVSGQIDQGENVIGSIVADGWYSGYVGFGLLVGYGPNRLGRNIYGKSPCLMAQLEIEYEDGTSETIVTDPTWKVTDAGPERQADLLMGEYYDARMELTGWETTKLDDSDWQQAILAVDGGDWPVVFYESGRKYNTNLAFVRPAILQSYPSQPVHEIERIKPIEITSPEKDVYIYNLGQNFAGIAEIIVKGKAGQVVRLRFGEMLHQDGRLMVENLRKARAHDYYVLRGDPAGETFKPKFTFHGFQFVEVTGLDYKPALDDLTGIVLHSDTPLISTFECSDPMVNKLFQNVVWTQRSNFLELPTDCPQRDERMGWTGDAQIYVRTATYNADVAAFYTKWLDELEESQFDNGAIPGYAPYPFKHGEGYGTAWLDAGIICPHTIFKVYDDLRVVRRHYDSMKRLMDFRASVGKDYLGTVHGAGWGDWLSIDEKTPLDYIDTVYWAYSAGLIAEMADAIGETNDAAEYRELREKIKAAFVKKYFTEDGKLKVDTQTAYVLAFFMNLVPEQYRKAAGDRLVEKLMQRGCRMTTGFLGTRPILPVLTSIGRHDLAVRLLQSHEYPSWGYEIDNGATTIWERWNSYTREGGFHNPGMNSFSHYSFGAVCEWVFRSLAGIDTDGRGFKRLTIRPLPPAPGSNPDHPVIDWVRASMDGPTGLVKTSWRRTPDAFELEVTIPAGTEATVYIPTSDPKSVTESGKPIDAETVGVRLIEEADGESIYKVGSGSYRFKASL